MKLTRHRLQTKKVTLTACAVAVLCVLNTAQSRASDRSRDVSELTKGVSEIARPGLPGTVALFGPKASAVVAAPVGGGGLGVVVASARLGRGRVVIFGHDGFLAVPQEGDTRVLMANAIHWASGHDQPKVGVLANGAIMQWLREAGIPVETPEAEDWDEWFRRVDVVVVSGRFFSDPRKANRLQEFVRSGGGLISAETGWGWQQLHPGTSLVEHPGNVFLSEAGLAWAGQTLASGGPTIPVKNTQRETHALDSLKLLQEVHEQTNRHISKEQLASARVALVGAASVLSAEDKYLRPSLQRLLKKYRKDLVPTPERPISLDQALLQTLLMMDMLDSESAPLLKARAHPSADAFPGAVPKDARRLGQRVPIKTLQHGWHSTGMYAAPGERVKVNFPQETVAKGFFVRIGCHTDDISGHSSWSRVPRISRRFPVDKQQLTVVNPYGGPIYIEVPNSAPIQEFEVVIQHAVRAPWYRHGITETKNWLEEIRNYPAPWAELTSDKICLSVPSRVIRELDDPEELMELWSRIADSAADLAVRPRERERPERYVADVQISAGYMHAGYPIMTHLDAAKPMVSTESLMAGRWGLFHELGHNHQSPHWTFGGTGEVTVNLFTLYTYETICDMTVSEARENCSAEWINRQLQIHHSRGATFEDWCRDPFLALGMYVQLRNAFGWEAFKSVFAEYRDDHSQSLPHNDSQKRDQWMVRFSKQVGQNLGPFFQAWGVPVSEEALLSIADLPKWFPEDWPL